MRAALLTSGLMALIFVSGASAQNIPTNPNVSLRVGQSTIIHGIRGTSCGAPAPNWSEAAGTLPSSSLGSFSDGGVGVRGSRSCGGAVPARAVRFKATKKGSEVVTIQGDPISITVN